VDDGFEWVLDNPSYSHLYESSATSLVWHATWGDGFLTIDEIWDDGNEVNGDGCDSTWNVESNFTCTGGTAFTASTWVITWGNGQIDNEYEKWDDGNAIDGDGCDSTWNLETGFVCTGGSNITASRWVVAWGNGQFDTGYEEWDDNNADDSDGCHNNCTVHGGYTWSSNGGSPPISECISNEAPTGLAAASVAIVGVGAVLSSVSSIAGSSGTQGAFKMIHLYQLYILLPMIGAFMPNEIINLILGNEIVLFSFSFLSINDIPLIINAVDKIKLDQTNDYLGNIGLESGSTMVNHLPFVTVLLLIGIAHLLFLPVFFKNCDNR
jgi:cysteine-rich repeat protein